MTALALFVSVQLYGTFFIDDGLISLRYTARLLAGEGLTWTDGERVEGYSNLAWILACAIPGLLGVDLILGARILGFACLVATFGALLAASSPRRVRDCLPALFASFLLSATDSIAVWTCSGLEVPLGVCLLAWAVALGVKWLETPSSWARWGATLAFGLLCWTRPDGPLWGAGAVLVLGGGFVRAKRPLALSIALGVIVFVGSQLAFRRLYYDDWLPNTAYAKVVLNDRRLDQGIEHVQRSLLSLSAVWLALVFGVVACASRARTRLVALLLATMAALWIGYLVRMGGDIFPAWRHFGYFAVLGALAWVFGFARESFGWSAAATGASLIVLASISTYFDPTNWAWTQRWEWDGRPVARALRLAAGKQRPLVAVDAAGSIPYFSRLPALDMLGLTDRYLAHHRPATMGDNAMGHELGDPDYFLARAPDLFCFGVPPCRHGGNYDAQREMVARREFSEAYVPVRLRVQNGAHDLVGEMYVRREGQFGLSRKPDRIEVPPLLLATGSASIAEVRTKRLVTRLDPGGGVTLTEVAVGAGCWLVDTTSDGEAEVSIEGAGERLASGVTNDEVDFSLEESSVVSLRIRAGETGVVLHDVHFRRLDAC